MLKDFFSSRLATLWLTFQIIFSFPHHVASSPLLLRQIDKPQGGFFLQRVTQMFAEGKLILREWSRLLQISGRGFMIFFFGS